MDSKSNNCVLVRGERTHTDTQGRKPWDSKGGVWSDTAAKPRIASHRGRGFQRQQSLAGSWSWDFLLQFGIPPNGSILR